MGWLGKPFFRDDPSSTARKNPYPFCCPNKVKSPSRCPSESLAPEYLVAYPQRAAPILIYVEDPSKTIWLPDNNEQDYQLTKNKKNSKWMLSSPALGYSKYVPLIEWGTPWT